MSYNSDDIVPMEVDTDEDESKLILKKDPLVSNNVDADIVKKLANIIPKKKIEIQITEDDIENIDRLPTETISDMFDEMFGFEPTGIPRETMINEIVGAYYESDGD